MGENLAVTIERLAAGGEGVAHAPDGRVMFVAGTAPGDRVHVRIVEEHPKWLRGEVDALEAPGPGRVEPRCPLFGRCGGCESEIKSEPRTHGETLVNVNRPEGHPGKVCDSS